MRSTQTGKAPSPNNGKVRFGVLGVARINRKVLPAIQRSPYAQLLAIGSRDLEKAQTAARTFEIPKAYDGYDAVLDDPDIDAVYIPLPNALHLDWVKKAAAAKKHVLCEKPLGLTYDEVHEAFEVCDRNGVYLMDGFMWPHHPRTRVVEENLKTGALGDLRHVHTAFHFLLDRSKPDIRRTKAMGGGALYDIGCYCVRASLFTFNTEPIAVTATARWENEIDTEMTALLEFEENRTASIHFGFHSPYQTAWEVTGTSKRLTTPFPWNPEGSGTLELWNASILENRWEFPKVNHIHEMVDTFSKHVLSGTYEFPEKGITLSLARVVDALYLSARKKERIVL